MEHRIVRVHIAAEIEVRLHRATSQILHELGVLALRTEKPARNRVGARAPEPDIVPVADGAEHVRDLRPKFFPHFASLLFEYRIDVPSFGALWSR
jgi:hypothetical protein